MSRLSRQGAVGLKLFRAVSSLSGLKLSRRLLAWHWLLRHTTVQHTAIKITAITIVVGLITRLRTIVHHTYQYGSNLPLTILLLCQHQKPQLRSFAFRSLCRDNFLL